MRFLTTTVGRPRIRTDDRPADDTGRTVGDAMGPPQLQISDDAVIDQAMDVLRASGTSSLLIRTEEGRCAGLLTGRQLDAYRDGLWYTERLRVGEIVHDTAPFALPRTRAVTALADMRARGLSAAPVVDDDGYVVGVVRPGDLESGTNAEPERESMPEQESERERELEPAFSG